MTYHAISRPDAVRSNGADTGLGEGRIPGEKTVIEQRDADMSSRTPGVGGTRFQIAALVHMMAQAVLFGAGAVVILLTPAFAGNLPAWFALNVLVSFFAAAAIAWKIAPRLRARYWNIGKPLRDAMRVEVSAVAR